MWGWMGWRGWGRSPGAAARVARSLPSPGHARPPPPLPPLPLAMLQVGSIFEYTARNPVFGVLPPSSPLYTPVLGLFALTGLPTAGWLFFKAIASANAEAERQDKLDGYKR